MCTGLQLSATLYFKTKYFKKSLFKICFLSQHPLSLGNTLHEQGSSERRAKHRAGTKQETWSWPVLSPSCKFVFCPLRLWLSICQNTVVVWDQEGWHKADLRHFYGHLKHLIREMTAARVWHLSNQILLLPEIAAKMGRVWRALSSSSAWWGAEVSLRNHLCTSWLSAICSRADPSHATSVLLNPLCRTKHLNPL